MARDIPGFYYDEDKKKYFRIQSNHSLPAASAAYSRQHVTAIRATKRTEIRRKQQTVRHHAGHVKRPPLSDTFSYKLLQCRITGSRSCQKLPVTEFVTKLTPRQACGADQHETTNRRQMHTHGFHVSREGFLTAATGSESNDVQIVASWPSSTYAQHREDAFVPSISRYDVHRFYPGLLMELVRGFNAPYTKCVSFSDASKRLHILNHSSSQPIYWAFDMNEPTTIWDTADSPTNLELAAATEHGIYLCHAPMLPFGPDRLLGLRRVQHTQTQTQSQSEPRLMAPPPKYKRMNAQLNVTYKDNNIIMSGERSGTVNFIETRTLSTELRLQHSSAVLGTLPSKHPSQIIVHGFSTSSIYDLRFIKHAPDLSKRTHKSARTHSVALIDFANPPGRHTDHYSPGKKLAYSADLDLVAACSASSSFKQSRNFVTLYSTITGRCQNGPLTNERFAQPVTAIEIKRIRDGPESIITLSNGELLEWTVHRDRESESVPQKLTRAQRQDLEDRKRVIFDLAGSKPELYSIARLWEEGNIGPR